MSRIDSVHTDHGTIHHTSSKLCAGIATFQLFSVAANKRAPYYHQLCSVCAKHLFCLEDKLINSDSDAFTFGPFTNCVIAKTTRQISLGLAAMHRGQLDELLIPVPASVRLGGCTLRSHSVTTRTAGQEVVLTMAQQRFNHKYELKHNKKMI